MHSPQGSLGSDVRNGRFPGRCVAHSDRELGLGVSQVRKPLSLAAWSHQYHSPKSPGPVYSSSIELKTQSINVIHAPQP